MIEINLLERPSAKDCHDVRAYWDEAGCLHWFEANAGWFKSNTAKPSAETIVKFLVRLFEFLKYNYFKCCEKHKIYVVNFERPIVVRNLTFKFDTKCTALSSIVGNVAAESSDDESETEQLKRWLANMRHTKF